MLPATPAPTTAPFRATEGVVLTVAHAGRAAEFYARVLFFEKTSDFVLQRSEAPVRVVRLRLGDEILELVEDASWSPQPLSIVVNDLEQAYLWLRRHRVDRISPSPRPDWDPETGDVRSVSFNDPD